LDNCACWAALACNFPEAKKTSVQMKTGIIIPTHRRTAMMERLLRDLANSTLPPNTMIYVVENGPRGGVREICEKAGLDGRLQYLYCPKGHKSAALNFAIESGTEDFLIFFDDDVALPGDIVATYTEAAQRYRPGHFFGGPLIAHAEIPCPAELVPYLPRSALGWVPANREVVMDNADFEYFFGANWAVFRSDLERVGLFSEELGITASPRSPMGEENEIQMRLLQAAVKPVYLPGAKVRHHVPRECYTTRWAWRRRFRLGVTDWKRTEREQQAHCRKLLGIPAWLLRAVIQQQVNVTLSGLFGWARKTELRMRHAYLCGLLHGAWTTRSHG